MTESRGDLLVTGGWTVDMVAALPGRPRYELVDGWLMLVDRPPVFQFPLVELMRALDEHCPPELMPVHRIPLEVDERSQPCPDVVVLKEGRLDRCPVPIEDALLIGEILPPDWHFRDLQSKERLYARAGVPLYWLLDRSEPAGFTLMVFRLEANGRYDLVESTHGTFTTTEPYPITLDLPTLTAMWRKRWERIRSVN
jgi:hypothetical protein